MTSPCKGPANKYSTGGDISAASYVLFIWDTKQRVLVLQNRTGGDMVIVLQGSAASVITDFDAIFVETGQTFTLKAEDGVVFDRVQVYSTLAAYPEGASKNFTIAAYD